LFSRRQSNERDIFRGSCIDVIKSWLRKNLKAPASSRIMPFLQTNKQTTLASHHCVCFFVFIWIFNHLHRYETELFSKWTPHVLSQFSFVCLFVCKNGIIRLEAGAFKFLRNQLFMTSMQLPRKMSRSLLWRRENNMRYSAK
jgi:hypothetical protein